jgi:hypothetical protein
VEKDLAKLGDETPTFSSRLDKKKVKFKKIIKYKT